MDDLKFEILVKNINLILNILSIILIMLIIIFIKL